MPKSWKSVRLDKDIGIDIDLPLEMAILNIANGIPPGGSNVYGPTYRDTYSYNGSSIQWMIHHNIALGIDPADYVIHYNPSGVIHLNKILLECNMLHVDQHTAGISSNIRNSIYKSKVEWSESTAWADSGSWGRVYINVRNRQSDGVICPTKFYEVRDDISSRIMSKLPGCNIYKPYELWDCGGVPPDLLVKFPGYEFGDMVNCDTMEDYSVEV